MSEGYGYVHRRPSGPPPDPEPGVLRFTSESFNCGSITVERVGGFDGYAQVTVYMMAEGAIVLEILSWADGEDGGRTINACPTTNYEERPIFLADAIGAGVDLDADEATIQSSGSISFQSSEMVCDQLFVERTGGSGGPASALVQRSPEESLGEVSWADGEEGAKTLDACPYTDVHGEITLTLQQIVGAAPGAITTAMILPVNNAGVISFASTTPDADTAYCSNVVAERTGGSSGLASARLRLVPTGGGEPIELGMFEWADGESGLAGTEVCGLTGSQTTGTLQLYDPIGAELGASHTLALVWDEPCQIHWGSLSYSGNYGPGAGEGGIPYAEGFVQRVSVRHQGIGSFEIPITAGFLNVPVSITAMDPENYALPVALLASFTPGNYQASVRWNVPVDSTDSYLMTWEIQPGVGYGIGSPNYPSAAAEVSAAYSPAPELVVAWDASTAAPDVTLSDSNHRADFATGTQNNVLSNVILPDGPVYFELVISAVSPSHTEPPYVGITRHNISTTDALPGGEFWGLAVKSGRVYDLALQVAQFPELADGDVLGFAYRPSPDFGVTEGRVWIRRNGEAYLGGGDPELNTDPTIPDVDYNNVLDWDRKRIVAGSSQGGAITLPNTLSHAPPAGFATIQQGGA